MEKFVEDSEDVGKFVGNWLLVVLQTGSGQGGKMEH